jgi:hypothetical protein
MATGAATKTHGFEWRTLLGPTHNWSIPTAELSTVAQQTTSMECCELCGEPTGDGRAFTTNSAGERAMHTACWSDEEPTCMERRLAGRLWEHLRQKFVGGWVASLRSPQT